MEKNASFYLECLLAETIDWENIPVEQRQEVLDLSEKRARQDYCGLGGGWEHAL